MEWARLVELVGRVRATPRRGEKVELIADLLRQARGRETALLALYLTGTLPQGRVGVGWKTLEPALPSGPVQGEPLTLARLHEGLDAVAAETGPGSTDRRLRLLRGLLEATDEPGRRLLVELLLGEVRSTARACRSIARATRCASLPGTCRT
jgi:DNA ligase-1